MRFWWSMQKEAVTSDICQLARTTYSNCIRYLDDQIGRLLTDLKDRGLLQNTLVIITSDHGEHLGEHGLYLHGNSLYQELIHVPLIFYWPEQIPPDLRVESPVSLAQLPVTVARIIGRTAHPFPGTPLQWAGPTNDDGPVCAVFSEIPSPPEYPPCQGASPAFRGAMRAIRVGHYKLISNDDGEHQLYDLTEDPGENNNLIDVSAYDSIIERLFTGHMNSLGTSDAP
jgi:arylsulfatase A-like enzyme